MTDQIKFSTSKRELLAALKWAAAGLPLRPVVPILAGMRLELDGGTLTVAGFDYEMTARASLPVDGITRGAVLVGGHQLVKAVRSLPGRKGALVVAEVSGDSLTVRSEGVSASAPILPMDEYPQLPAMPEAAGVLAAAEFAGMARRVAVAAGHDDTLPVLTGVNLAFSADGVTFTATDRYRAAIGEASWTSSRRKVPAVTVPAVALVAFAGVADLDGKVTVHVGKAAGRESDPFVAFSDGTHEMITRTIGGDFPRMADRFPSQVQASADLDGTALAAALKRAGAQADRNTPAFLRIAGDRITVTAHGEDGADTYSETLALADELDAPRGEGYRVTGWRAAYNPMYLASLAASAGSAARLSWAKPGAPVMVCTADPADRFRGLVMPIRVPV